METLLLDLDISTPSVKETLAKINVNSQLSTPVTLSGQVAIDFKEDSISIDNTHLALGDNTLSGTLHLLDFNDPLKRPQVEGTIELLNVNLMQLRDRPMGIRAMSGNPTSTEKTGMLLSDSTLPLTALTHNDINLKIRIGQFMSTLFDVSEAVLALRSENGVLSLGPFTGMVNRGQAKLHLIVDTNQKPPAVNLTASVDAFDLARAGLFQNSELIENTGGTTMMLNLAAHGDSIAAIMASANGEGGLYIEDLVLRQGMLKVLSSDLLDQLIDAINPARERGRETRLTCSALTFQMDDGTLDTPMGFAVESDKFAILGKANIDFDDESINIMINSKPRKGLGFSLNRLVNLVEVNGRLANPQLSLSETGLLRLGASLAAAVASSGVTLLAEGLWEKQQANSDVCARALGN